ncbi:hypothetical protein J2I47_10975 [Fibrella sp. HMF5335]|uniref:Uncharacterized protein n=1 Tax=Fibrella rubiginis TaxID=2817060 RepID=A0A939GIH0_9BACT|nr:hypothetical protein [Fibrella rubiginis]MBO0937068.1 hypothetical protein [Fibrella rubiginis]
MKTLTIDLKSVFLGAGLMGGLLLMANKPAPQAVQQPVDEVRRYQAVTGERGVTILDTKTGRFIVDPYGFQNPRWTKGDFEEIHARQTK